MSYVPRIMTGPENPGLGRTLHLTKYMNGQMVEFGFQVNGES